MASGIHPRVSTGDISHTVFPVIRRYILFLVIRMRRLILLSTSLWKKKQEKRKEEREGEIERVREQGKKEETFKSRQHNRFIFFCKLGCI